MLRRLSRALIHLLGFALVCAVAAYWVIRIVTPPPTAAPVPVSAPAPRDIDPVLAARVFGLVQVAQAAPVVANVQVAGVFAAGRDSAAVLVVDNKPARAYLLGQEVAPGSTLVAVRGDGVTLEANGARQDLGLAGQPTVAVIGGAPPVGYVLNGGVLSAPAQDGSGAPVPPPPAAGAGAMPGLPGRPGVRPVPPQMPAQQPPQPPMPPYGAPPGMPQQPSGATQ